METEEDFRGRDRLMDRGLVVWETAVREGEE